MATTQLLQSILDFLGLAVDYVKAIRGGDEKQRTKVATGLFNDVHSTNYWSLLGMYWIKHIEIAVTNTIDKDYQ